MMSAKLATLGLFKTNIFWHKSSKVISFIRDVIKKILSRDSNYIVDVVMLPKFGNSNISMWEVILILDL